jgi:hypothetical protein
LKTEEGIIHPEIPASSKDGTSYIFAQFVEKKSISDAVLQYI